MNSKSRIAHGHHRTREQLKGAYFLTPLALAFPRARGFDGRAFDLALPLRVLRMGGSEKHCSTKVLLRMTKLCKATSVLVHSAKSWRICFCLSGLAAKHASEQTCVVGAPQ